MLTDAPRRRLLLCLTQREESMRQFQMGAATAALLAFTAPPAAAQGFWAGLGVGTGRQHVTCEICRGDGNGGWAVRAAAGSTLSASLRLGGELHGWTDKTDDVRFTFYAVTPTLYWYPAARRSYFLMAGAGYANYKASSGDETISASSIGLTFGAGYEVPLVGRYALAPFASYTGSFLANLKSDRTIITGAQLSLFQLGVGITWR
jgi:hypothetical protein